MEASQVFRLTRTSLHQLTSLNHIAAIPVLPLLSTGTKIMSNMPAPTTHFASRATDAEFRIPHGSFLSLRTFYAFGARSGRIPSLQRSLSYNTHGSNLVVGSFRKSTEANSTLQRSLTATSIQRSKHNVAYHNRYFTPVSSISKPFSSSILQARTPSISQSTTSQMKRDSRNNQSRKTEQSYLPAVPRNTITTSAPYPVDVQNPTYHNENQKRLQYEQPAKVSNSPPKKDEARVTKEDSIEMTALIGRNKSLESEVELLRSRLRDKERSERELRRKVLEYAAEVKVWKKKFEMQQSLSAEISEPKGSEEEFGDIMEQLNIAAERLTRLNAVKDLKLLQSEMETALKEISK